MRGEQLIGLLAVSLTFSSAQAGELFPDNDLSSGKAIKTNSFAGVQLTDQRIKVLGLVQSKTDQKLKSQDYGIGMSYRLTPWLDSQIHWVNNENHLKLKVDL